MSAPLSPQHRIRGCLLGGAVGDALGAPVEFDSHADIVRTFGPRGIRDLVPVYGIVGAITDDTQMSLWVAEGLIRASVRAATKGICAPSSVIHHALFRWLKTQGETPARLGVDIGMDGWLIGLRQLWERRAPGTTCVTALREATGFGAAARNDSKGCGAVMRAAPIGLGCVPNANPDVFRLSLDVAALTHGHPTSSLCSGFLAVLVSHLVDGMPLAGAIENARCCVAAEPDNAESLAAIDNAMRMAANVRGERAAVEQLGQGWIAEEALAIALYCVLATPGFEQAVILAVNHGGDSDSTGAMAGNIAGALYGADAVPGRWLGALELRDEIIAVADDLRAVRDGTLDGDDDRTWARYPGW